MFYVRYGGRGGSKSPKMTLLGQMTLLGHVSQVFHFKNDPPRLNDPPRPRASQDF